MDIEQRVRELESLYWAEKGRAAVLERAVMVLVEDMQIRQPAVVDMLLHKPPTSEPRGLSPEAQADFSDGMDAALDALRAAVTVSEDA